MPMFKPAMTWPTDSTHAVHDGTYYDSPSLRWINRTGVSHEATDYRYMLELLVWGPRQPRRIKARKARALWGSGERRPRIKVNCSRKVGRGRSVRNRAGRLPKVLKGKVPRVCKQRRKARPKRSWRRTSRFGSLALKSLCRDGALGQNEQRDHLFRAALDRS